MKYWHNYPLASKKDESLLCLPNASVFRGDTTANWIYLPEDMNLHSADYAIMPRSMVDNSNIADQIAKTFVHPIPYVLVRHNGKYLTYDRGGTEKLLDNKVSVGFGGHVEAKKLGQPVMDLIMYAMRRELEEEIGIAFEHSNKLEILFGIRSDADVVSTRHLGLVAVVDLTNQQMAKIALDEKEIFNPRWLTITDLIQVHNLENWSQIVVGILHKRHGAE